MTLVTGQHSSMADINNHVVIALGVRDLISTNSISFLFRTTQMSHATNESGTESYGMEYEDDTVNVY